MQGIPLVPDPLWWLMGAIVSFYFGARHRAHAQDFQCSIAQTMARVPTVVEYTRVLMAMSATTPQVADSAPSARAAQTATRSQSNPALHDWVADTS
jgi:hypothetical protein